MPDQAAPSAAPAASAPASAPSAPAAAPSSPAPSSAPASAPSTSAQPAAQPATNTPGQQPAGGEPKRSDFATPEAYSAALLKHEFEQIPAEDTTQGGDATATEQPPQDATAPATEDKPADENQVDQPNEATEEQFRLDDDEPAVDPELLSQLAKDNPDFGKLLEADPKLKGQLFKTAREAAQLKPFRELFSDVESARFARDNAATFVDVRETFMGSTTPEGTMATLDKMAELSWERDDQGKPIIDPATGKEKIGDDFYGFLDNVRDIGRDHDRQEIQARLDVNRYGSAAEKERDELAAAALDVLKEYHSPNSSASEQDIPESLRDRAAELDRREKELNQRTNHEKVSERQQFEKGIEQEAVGRVSGAINRILESVVKQGAVISPFVKEALPNSIGSKLMKKIAADPSLKSAMADLQRLPIGSEARRRRLELVDKAVQDHLPDIARAELKSAGIQVMANQASKREKIDAQTAASRSEPKGATSVAGPDNKPMNEDTAWDQAKAHWQKNNPGKQIDREARGQIGLLTTRLLTGQRLA